ncbi:Hha/YmoA family nucleoid-associated regulatory protein [Enterobacter ludwigii]
MDWLLKLRRFSERDTFEKIAEKKQYELNDAELTVFWSATDWLNW